MKKFYQNTIVSLVFLLLLSLVIPNGISNAQADQSTGEISNFNEVRMDGRVLEYTYDKDGESYKVLEVIDKDYKDVSSKIYMKNDAGEFELYAKKRATIEDHEMTVTTHKDEKTSKESFEVKPKVIQNSKEINSSEMASKSDIIGPMLDPGGWQYRNTTYMSDKIKGFTVGAIAVVVSATIPGATATIAAGIASLAYQLSLHNLYYKTDWYYKYEGVTPVAEMKKSWVYSDYSRTDVVEGPIWEYNYL